jgi:hypothetical protein
MQVIGELHNRSEERCGNFGMTGGNNMQGCRSQPPIGVELVSSMIASAFLISSVTSNHEARKNQKISWEATESRQ